ncbi:MAG: molybdopterin-binding protein [Deltaproteobacteria bacterium]|nr:molybdopterin-binding protein [Deltaproteobacteria bacterium]
MSEIKYKSIPLQEAVGMMLAHDMTQILPGEFKGPAFKKGHIIKQEDVSQLLDMGKQNIYAFDPRDGFVHENDAAERIAKAACGRGIRLTEPSEGRINFISTGSGLLKINKEALLQINSVEDITFATIHGNQIVFPETGLAGTRIIPLVTAEKNIAEVESICKESYPVIDVKPFRNLKVGVVTTGTEVYSGRIKDKFGPVLKKKFAKLNCEVIRQVFVSDDVEKTVNAIHELINEGAELVALTGGMSVDPDDQTPTSIRAAGAKVITYGAPVYPGAMFMLGYIDDIPVVGLPGCVMYHRASIFELIVPMIVAGEEVTKEYISSLGHGGFCSNCKECRYPVCGFGKR